MFTSRPQRQCFIIGPMKDDRLQRLAINVIEPLLKELATKEVSYTVTTPWDLGGNHIMNDVIYAIDRADLVIADLTGENPNVFYELGITHALGRPCVSVLEKSDASTPFDIRAYRYYQVQMNFPHGTDEATRANAYREARDLLRDPLKKAHDEVDWSRFENPVIDFFRAPITYISPAFSLAQGYYLNFVKPVVESMIKKKGTARYIYDIGIGTGDAPRPNDIEDAEPLDNTIRQRLKLQIIVPDRITYTQRNYVDRMRDSLIGAVVETDGRNMTCFYRAYNTPNGGTQHTLIDIPTTVRSMRDAIERRMRHHNVSMDHDEWREVEQQEIERFLLNLQLLIDKHDSNPEFKDSIEIVRYNYESPGDLLWMHNIIVGA